MYKIVLILINLLFLQLIWNVSILVLGFFRSCGPHDFRTDRNQKLHQILGSPDIWVLLGDKYHRPSQYAYRHDVKLLSNYFGKWWYIFWYLKKINKGYYFIRPDLNKAQSVKILFLKHYLKTQSFSLSYFSGKFTC